MTFEKEEKLMFAYSIEPHEVYELDVHTGEMSSFVYAGLSAALKNINDIIMDR